MPGYVLFSIHGRVQGVGYRQFVARKAAQRGISGIVRNVSDGSVEVFASGDADSLGAFVKEIDVDTPSGASVMKIERRELSGKERTELGLRGSYSGFSVERTRVAD